MPLGVLCEEICAHTSHAEDLFPSFAACSYNQALLPLDGAADAVRLHQHAMDWI